MTTAPLATTPMAPWRGPPLVILAAAAVMSVMVVLRLGMPRKTTARWSVYRRIALVATRGARAHPAACRWEVHLRSMAVALPAMALPAHLFPSLSARVVVPSAIPVTAPLRSSIALRTMPSGWPWPLAVPIAIPAPRGAALEFLSQARTISCMTPVVSATAPVGR